MRRDYDATHRCEGSLAAGASIRRMGYPAKGDPTAWHIGFRDVDFDYDAWWMDYQMSPVRFCPFCGEELP